MNRNLISCILSVIFLSICTESNAQPLEGKKYSDHYNRRYAEFEKEPPVTSGDIVFLGNSLTEGGQWSEYFGRKGNVPVSGGGAIRNRGIVGDDAPGIYDRLNQILPGKPAKIFLLAGVNDISHNISADSVLVLIDRVIERIRRESPDTGLYLQSLLPINERKNRYKTMTGKSEVIREINTGLKEIAKRYGIKFINLYPYFTEKSTGQMKPSLTGDGLHINPEGYAIWAKRIKKYIK